MLTEELKEKKQRILLVVQDEFIRAVQENRLFFPLVRCYIAEAFLALRDGEPQEAWWRIRTAYENLWPSPSTFSFYSFYRADKMQYALSILDIGLFAFRLEGSFFYLHDVFPHLWERRKVFRPHLSEVLRATYYFLCSIEAGHSLEDALGIALRVRSELYEAFGSNMYGGRMGDISMLLPPESLAELRQLLLGLARGKHIPTSPSQWG